MLRENWKGHCWHCNQPLSSANFNRESRCPACKRAVHACKNCKFYKPGYANDCTEPVAEYVTEKDRANFCDYFEPAEVRITGSGRPDPDDLLQAAHELFDS